MYNDESHLTDIDMTEALFENENASWAIVMPGLVKEGKNTYWLYYYGSDMQHSEYLSKTKVFKYYRIKVQIKEKFLEGTPATQQ